MRRKRKWVKSDKCERSNVPCKQGEYMRKDFVYKEFLRKEENILRAPYNPELEFYAVIKSGDVQKAEELCKDIFTDKKGLGIGLYLVHNILAEHGESIEVESKQNEYAKFTFTLEKN